MPSRPVEMLTKYMTSINRICMSKMRISIYADVYMNVSEMFETIYTIITIIAFRKTKIHLKGHDIRTSYKHFPPYHPCFVHRVYASHTPCITRQDSSPLFSIFSSIEYRSK
jgi:hypothetical protein